MGKPGDWLLWRKAISPQAEFEVWLDSASNQIAVERNRGSSAPMDISEWSKTIDRRLQGEARAEAYRTYLRDIIQQQSAIFFRIHAEPNTIVQWRLEELPSDKLIASVSIHHCPLERGSKLRISELRIRNSRVELSNCYIGTLILEAESIELVLKNCWIGRLDIQDSIVFGDSSITGGGILSIATPRPGSKLFKGYLEIARHTYVPVGPTPRMPTPNAYLFLRHQLAEVGNTEAAGFFSRAEHYFNYRKEPGAARYVSFLYWLTCDYGTSVTRPLLWTLSLVAAGTAFGFTVGPVLDPDFLKHATELATAGPLRATWYSAFLDEGWHARLARATAAAWGAAVNPFSVFGDRGVVLMPSWWSNLILKLIGASTTLSIAMLFLAIRRRFRLS